MYLSAALTALWPPRAVTSTSTCPAPTALGATQLRLVAAGDRTWQTTALVPKFTVTCEPDVGMKLVPVMITVVVPVTGPLLGLIWVTEGGGGAGYVYEGPPSLWPPVVFTTTGTLWVPAIDPVRGGTVTTICVLLVLCTAAGLLPKVTDAEVPKLMPEMMTVFPPFHVPAGPVAGFRPLLSLLVIPGP